MTTPRSTVRIGARRFTILAAVVLAAALGTATKALAADSTDRPNTVYVAHLHPLNSGITGLRTTGEATFAIVGDTLTISITALGVPPSLVHWQHFHGFVNDRAATYPTKATDANHDDIIDLTETEPMSGTTMVPFIEDPVTMDVAHGVYPKASASGAYNYQQTVSLKALEAAFAKAFEDPNLVLDRRVVFIHGILPSSTLPASVASLGPIPAHVTLPIACGTIEKVTR